VNENEDELLNEDNLLNDQLQAMIKKAQRSLATAKRQIYIRLSSSHTLSRHERTFNVPFGYHLRYNG
jgi:hypothetical protein